MSFASLPAIAARTRVTFDHPSTAIAVSSSGPVLRLAVKCLAGGSDEALSTGTALVERHGVWLGSGSELVAGFAVAREGLDPETATDDLYQRLFAATAGRNLYRVWNYLPHINETTDGLENYRRFCRARSLAFERRFGPDFEQRLPAGSAVGSTAGPLAVAFVAGPTAARFFENPEQVPAFAYPPEHSPRPPSFSRAARVEADGAEQVYISGTAAIRGHQTVAPGDLDAQLTCTLENLRLIAAATGVGLGAQAGGGWSRRFKIYLRHAHDLSRTADRLERELLMPGDQVSYLRADICRRELVVEIEASLAGGRT